MQSENREQKEPSPMIRKYWRYSTVELAYIIPTHLNRTRLSQALCDTCHHLSLSLALWTCVWAIVTAETDVEIEIADIVGMRSPINPYFREPCAAVICWTSSTAVRISNFLLWQLQGELRAH